MIAAGTSIKTQITKSLMSNIENKVNSSVVKALKYALEQTARNSKSNSAKSLSSNYTAGKGISGASTPDAGTSTNSGLLTSLLGNLL